MTTVLVTGAGAIIGYGILRSLRNAGLRLVAIDIHADAVGQHWADAFEQSVMVADPGYIDFLRDIIRRHNVELVIPGIEQDVAFFAENEDGLDDLGACVCLNNPALIRLAQDKWLTYEFLVQSGFRAIPTRLDGDFATLSETLGVPFLLKPRRGYAGKGIIKIASRDDFDRTSSDLGPRLIAQRIVGEDDAEYTVSGFGDATGTIGQLIALRRRLSREGSTVRAELVNSAPFEEVIGALSSRLQPRGPTNFQFRVEREVPYLLEINPRISSATSIRAAFGYNEAMMTVDYFLHGKLPKPAILRPGKVTRFIEDYVQYVGDPF